MKKNKLLHLHKKIDINKYLNLKRDNPNLYKLFIATMFLSIATGIVGSIINNYLSDIHKINAVTRGWLELAREFPGSIMLIVVPLILLFLAETKIASLSVIFIGIGAFGIAHLTTNISALVIFTIVFSIGDHIIFTVEGPIGLQLAKEGKEGKRLGQIGAIRNFGAIIGIIFVYIISKLSGDNYSLFYSIAGFSALIAGHYYFSIKQKNKEQNSHKFNLVFRKKYSLFYIISIIFGTRKQIFLVFAGWVLVKIYNVPLSTMALLYFIGSCISIFFRQLLGEVIDWFGERLVLAAEEILIIIVCLTYAFASNIFPKPFDLYVLFATYILDYILFALRIARTTYLKKIAIKESDITPTLSIGISIDHLISMVFPIFSGYLWEIFGYKSVFLATCSIAILGFFICLRIKTEK